jgi:hypothetical protein
VNPDSWRAALRVVTLLLRLGELSEPSEQQTLDVRAMTPEQREAAIAKSSRSIPGSRR